MRLRELLLGGADSRQEIQGVLTLQMQDRHRRLREALATVDAELAGVVPANGGAESNGTTTH